MDTADSERLLKYFKGIFEVAAEGIFVVDSSGHIQKCNPAFEKLLGFHKRELQGKLFTDIAHHTAKIQKATSPLTLHFFLHSSEFPLEMELINKKGMAVPVRLRSVLIKSNRGEVVEAIGIVEGVRKDTSEIRLERKREESQETLPNKERQTLLDITQRLYLAKGFEEVLDVAIEGIKPLFSTFGNIALLSDDKHYTTIMRIYMDNKILSAIERLVRSKFIGFNILLEEGNVYTRYYKEKIPAVAHVQVEGTNNVITTDMKTLIEDFFEKKSTKRKLAPAISTLTGYHSSILVPFISEKGETFGNIAIADKRMLNHNDFSLLKIYAGIIAGALERKKAEAELRMMYKQLQARAQELKAVNQQLIASNQQLRASENALRESEERYHNLLEFANAGIIASENDKIIQVNRKAEEIYGYSKDELLGHSPSILTPEKYRKSHREILQRIVTSGTPEKMIFEEEGLKKDGSLLPVEISFTLTLKEKNLIIAVIRDITERKEMEHRLLQSEKLRSLGELAGGVAHDFNNVLAAILGRVQLVRMQMGPAPEVKERRKTTSDLKKSLEIIEKAALDGAETIRRIQEFSRRRDDDKYFTEVDPNKVIDDALEFTKVRWKDEVQTTGTTICIRKEFSPLPTIAGSAPELREVITNLINNAIDAMPHGGTINIRTLMDNGQVVIKLRDTGIGIPSAIADRIFDPFFTTKGPQSTGLGLSVSYGIINRHGGTVKLESVEGKGSTFTIQLPLVEQKIKDENVTPRYLKIKRARILVIEDEDDVRELLEDILMSAGHEVVTASHGTQGITLFRECRFDMVFTDLGMPGISGWQVADEIKKIHGETPVALITGWEVQFDHHPWNGSGVDFIVSKPFQVDQVLQLVQKGLKLKGKALH